MFNATIIRALDHSPRHKNEIMRALARLGADEIERAAGIVRGKCAELSIAEFPNPFLRGTDDHVRWEIGFTGVVPPPAPPPAPSVTVTPGNETDMPNFVRMTKEKIEQWVFDTFGINLNTRMRKDDLIAEAERIAREHA